MEPEPTAERSHNKRPKEMYVWFVMKKEMNGFVFILNTTRQGKDVHFSSYTSHSIPGIRKRFLMLNERSEM